MKRLIKLIISKFYLFCKRYIRNYNELPTNYFQKDSTSTYLEGSGTKKHNYSIVLSENSNLIIGKNVTIKNAKIMVRDNSIFEIGDNCVIEDTDINIQHFSSAIFEPFVITGKSHLVRASIIVNKAEALLKHHSRFYAEKLQIRFGGFFQFGEYSGISHSSEIRCENKVVIGKNALISYDVCIYDTNAHSTDFKVREKIIHENYPRGPIEKEERKPDTKPVIIGHNVWIGKGATVTKGAKIGDNVIIGMRTNIGGVSVPENAICVSDRPRIISTTKTQ